MVIVQRRPERVRRDGVVDDGEAPGCLVALDLPTDTQPPEIKAVFFSSRDDQCLRHVLLLLMAGNALPEARALQRFVRIDRRPRRNSWVESRPVEEREGLEMKERTKKRRGPDS